MSKATLAGAELRYEDRPELNETFADLVQRITFDGRTLRIEFCAVRMDEPDTKAKKSTGKSVPVSRIVLDLDGAVDFLNKMNSMQAALQNQGVIKTTPAPAPTQPAATKGKA
jgi:hypothetical protein